MKKYRLAIDIGASSGRHILEYMQDGKMVLEEIYRFPNGAKNTDGSLYWDVDSLFENIVAGLAKAKELGKIPETVGIDTWAVDYALLDKDDRRIGEVFSYRDGRTQESAEKAHKLLPFASLYEKTGIQFQPFNTVYQLYADKLTGKIEGAESMLMLPDYFNFLLTGIKRQEYTNATSTGMVNALTHTWDEEIIQTLGLPQKLFGELTLPGSVVGKFSKEIEERVGYCATVMLPATHDTASAVLAAPIEKGQPYISSGTWSLLGIEQSKAHTDPKSMAVNYSNEGSLNYTFRYQKNIMGLWMIQQVRHELNDEYSFAELADMARANPKDIFIDVNDNKFLSPANMTAAIEEETGKLSVGEMAYVIYSGLAKCYKKCIEELEELTGEKYHTLYIIGGGSKNTLLNEMTAKETGLRVVTGPTEGTAIGNLIMQMIGSGEIKDLKEARSIVKKSFNIEEVE